MSKYTEAILEKVNTLVVVSDCNANAEYIAPSVKRILGYEPEELLGEKWLMYTRDTDDERNFMKSYVKDLLNKKNKGMSSYEKKLRTSTGNHKWIMWNTSLGPDNTIIAIGYDITKRKIAEEKLQYKNLKLKLQNKDIIESIEYAKRLQESILPDIQNLNLFDEVFSLYQPKDMISGDFYWYYVENNIAYVAAVDCTGHGVPGALMSVLGNSILRDVIIKRGIDRTSDILQTVDEELALVINKNSVSRVCNDHTEFNNVSDGMDIALCKFDFNKQKVYFSGAFRPLLKIRDNDITEYKGNRYPIGFYMGLNKKFDETEIDLRKGDTFYMFSDGYSDQFGGDRAKKLNKTRFYELLLSIQDMNLQEQESFLNYSLNNWKQDIEQTDDILVMGLKV